MPLVAKSDLSTGNLTHASYLLRSGNLSFVFTAPYSPSIAANEHLEPNSTASIPTFDREYCLAFVSSHGLAVRAIALEVENADTAFHISVANGAKPTASPVLLHSGVTLAEVLLYGDVVLRYISYTDPSQASDPNPSHWFLPKFEPVEELPPSASLDYEIRGLDHAVCNVPELVPAVNYVQGFTGFHEFSEFMAEDVGDSSQSGMNQMVLANNDETVLLPLCEPVFGTKRKSQIQTFLEHNEGAGLQHVALVSEDIFRTLEENEAAKFHRWVRVHAFASFNLLQESQESELVMH